MPYCKLHVRIHHVFHLHKHLGGAEIVCSSGVLRSEDVIWNVWGREIGHAEECREVFIDDFYLVGEEIVLGPFPAHLGRTRLGRTRLGVTGITSHPAVTDKSSTT